MATVQTADEVDIVELFNTLRRGWLLLFGIAAFVIAAAVAVVLILPNQYKAAAVLSPAMGNTPQGALAQLGGLASLAGISIPAATGDESQVALEVIQSWGFIDGFIRANDLAVPIFAAKGWDEKTGELRIDDSLYDVSKHKWIRETSGDKPAAPTSWELYKAFSERLSVSQDANTGLVNIEFEFYSPEFARDVLQKYVAALNHQMRARKLEETGRNINYLNDQISKTSVAELKTAFYKLVEEETKNRMLAEARPEYSFITVSAPMIPEQVSSPRRVLILILAVFLGGFIGSLAVLGRSALQRRTAR